MNNVHVFHIWNLSDGAYSSTITTDDKGMNKVASSLNTRTGELTVVYPAGTWHGVVHETMQCKDCACCSSLTNGQIFPHIDKDKKLFSDVIGNCNAGHTQMRCTNESHYVWLHGSVICPDFVNKV